MSNKNNKNTSQEPKVEEVTAAEAPAADAPAAEAPAAGASAKILLRAVHGTMIHPYVPMDIRTDAITEVDQIDSWLQSQIDEKKIVIV